MDKLEFLRWDESPENFKELVGVTNCEKTERQLTMERVLAVIVPLMYQNSTQCRLKSASNRNCEKKIFFKPGDVQDVK